MTVKKTALCVVVSKNGPYVVTGSIPLSTQTIATDAEGGSERWIEGKSLPVREQYRLCRCGQSRHKPFCDDSHAKLGFNGTETADRSPYRDQANIVDGPTMQLSDAEALCAFARFCDPNGQVWAQVTETDNPKVRETFIRQVGNCPAGRLVAWDKATGKAVEPKLPVSIGLIEDPTQRAAARFGCVGGSRSSPPTGTNMKSEIASRCAGAANQRTNRSAMEPTPQ